jgi:sugar phosphate isomerase/epimerase
MSGYGVSPAFVFSRHTTHYSVEDCGEALRLACQLGFASFQPEVYHHQRLEEWTRGGAVQLATLARDQGVMASQFVGHFLMHGFGSKAALADGSEVEAVRRVCELAAQFPGCGVLTVPLARYQPDPVADAGAAAHGEAWALLCGKVGTYLEAVRAAGLKFALELLPYSLVVNSDGFLRLVRDLGSPSDLGVNLDTGHAWAQREVMELLPSKLRGRIFGVHLKDNNSDVNQPLAPGQGTIAWAPLLRGIRAAGYTGSWDLEIGCAPEWVAAEYTEGLNHLKSLNIP